MKQTLDYIGETLPVRECRFIDNAGKRDERGYMFNYVFELGDQTLNVRPLFDIVAESLLRKSKGKKQDWANVFPTTIVQDADGGLTATFTDGWEAPVSCDCHFRAADKVLFGDSNGATLSKRKREKMAKAGRAKAKVKDKADRTKIHHNFWKWRKGGYTTDRAAARRVLDVVKYESQEKNVLDLKEPYFDLTEDDVKRIAGVKDVRKGG